MVDPERLKNLLNHVTERVSRLHRFSGMDQDELLADEERMAALERTFQAAIEACIDAAQHVCASEGWGPPKDNADAMRTLAAHGVIDDPLAELMAAAVRFRNVLVHLYADVDPQKVVDHLRHLDDIERYVGALAELVES